MSNYSKGIISIPEVTGNLNITVTTQGQAVNLFDPTTALYNTRVRGTGSTESGVNGILTTAPIDISNISTFTIGGVEEVYSSSYGYYAYLWAYSDASATTKVGSVPYSSSATYTMDVASMKASYPTGIYCRVVLVLKNNIAISTADTTNLTIYGS